MVRSRGRVEYQNGRFAASNDIAVGLDHDRANALGHERRLDLGYIEARRVEQHEVHRFSIESGGVTPVNIRIGRRLI